jgi:hypothetical protein
MNAVSTRRVAAVTAGLVGAGAVFGAMAGALALGIAEGITAPGDGLDGIVFAGLVGGFLGGIGAPLAGWLFLRRVPLGQLFMGSVMGTVLGGVVGWVLPFGSDEVGNGLLGAIAGFGFATLWMWSRTLTRGASKG